MVFDKKGQGISLNTIVIAALALIVLVVLIVIFTGRISIFEEKLGEEADAQLSASRASYGNCHPSVADESEFKSEYRKAGGVDSEQEQFQIKEEAKQKFNSRTNQCRQTGSDKETCEAADCVWS